MPECRPIADVRLCGQNCWVMLKRLALAFSLGAIASVACFFPMKAALTIWYVHNAHHDGLSGLGVIAGSLYFALACGAVIFGIILSRPRKKP